MKNNIVETLNPKLETLNKHKTQNSKQYDLRDRTLGFSKRIVNYVDSLSHTISNIEIARQLIRAAGSVGANYIEAEESLSRKDFVLRMKISRKEAKESIYWLKLSKPGENLIIEQQSLIQEATELMKIFGSIVEKSK